jgi:hypothetical protein
LVREIAEEERSVEEVSDIFNSIRGQLLEYFTCDEVVAWGSYGREVVDDSLYLGIFESVGREFELVRRF